MNQVVQETSSYRAMASRSPVRSFLASRFWKAVVKYHTMYLFLLPAIIVVSVFSYRPMIGVIMAFQDYDVVRGMFDSPWVGLEHFRAFLADKDFYRALRNTLAINALYIGIGFPLPIALAIVIFDMKDTVYKRVTQTISYLPHFVSWVAIAGIVYKLLDYHEGILNILLRTLGGEAVPFMRRPEFFWWIAVIVTIWKGLGWNTIIYLAALSGIPSEQYEAAIVDGANWFQQLIYITLPSIAPTIALMLIFTIGTLVAQNSAIGFDAIYNLRNAMVSEYADNLDYYVYAQGILRGRYSFATAVGLVQGLVSLLLVMSANTISRRLRKYGAF
jgi:putative aldouronate transport system permease protein